MIMYRIIKSDNLWYIFAPKMHRPFAVYSSITECFDVLKSTDNCDKVLVILR